MSKQNGYYTKDFTIYENGNGTDEDTSSRQHPHSQEAEEALLGSILIDPDVIYSVDLSPDMFYFNLNGLIFKHMKELSVKNMDIDFVTLNSRLMDLGFEEAPFLLSLVSYVPTSVNFRSYESVIRDMHSRREIIRTAQRAANLAFDGEEGVQAIVGTVTSNFGAILDNTEQGKLVGAKEAYEDVLDYFTGVRSGKIETKQIATGFIDLDRVLDGGFGEDLIVIAGRPGMGKSTIEKQIRLNCSARGLRVAHFNLEMSQIQLRMREIAGLAVIDYAKLKNVKTLSDADWMKVNDAIGKLSEYGNYIDTYAHLVDSIVSRARSAHMEKPFDLLTIDYLQLIKDNQNHHNKNLEVAEISGKLKRLSIELGIPVVVIAQLSRQVEHRAIKKPILSDLRDSGAIEQDADVVIFLYRDEYYNPDTERPNICEVEVAKNRHGPTGTVDLFFHGRTYRFMNLQQQSLGTIDL